MSGMSEAFGLLTIVGRRSAESRPPGPSAPAYYPLVGVVIGALVAGASVLVALGESTLVAAGVGMMLDAILTGGLHLDGVMDCGDGLIAPLDRGRRLEVMADPNLGAFGVLAGLMAVGLRWTAWAGVLDLHLSPLVLVVGLAGLYCLARSLAAVIPVLMPYARPGGGLGAHLTETDSRRHCLIGTWGVPVGIAALIGALGGLGLAVATLALISGFGMALAARRRLGGFTGDVLGAVIVATEAGGLVAMAWSWR